MVAKLKKSVNFRLMKGSMGMANLKELEFFFMFAKLCILLFDSERGQHKSCITLL